MNAMEIIRKKIQENSVILFMKGTPDFPQCGFSMRTAQALQACKAEFAHVDVIAEPAIRQQLPQYSNWPTFPQLFVNGEFIGGCDIVLEMSHKGTLQEIIPPAAEK